MVSFTDLPDYVAAEILCDWCDVEVIAKADSAFCSNHRTWLLNIISKYCGTVPKTVNFSFDFLKWVFIREIDLKDLQFDKKMIVYNQHNVSFRLSGVESLTFGPCGSFDDSFYDIRWDDLDSKEFVTVVNGCSKLKMLSFNSPFEFRDFDLPLISPLILSQLVSLELHHEMSDLKETLLALSVHCINLSSLVLIGEEMCPNAVMKMIASNPKLKSLAVDCSMLTLSDIYEALKAAGNIVVTHITVDAHYSFNFFDPVNLFSGVKLLQYYKDKSLVYLNIDHVLHYEVEKYDHSEDKEIVLGVHACAKGIAKALFDELPVVNTVCFHFYDRDSMQLVTEYYCQTLTSLIFVDNWHKPMFTSSIVERMLTSSKNVKHLKLVSANQLDCKKFQRLCVSCPQLRHIEFDNTNKITTATVIAILSSSTSNVTKVTTKHCQYVVPSEVHEAIAKLNAMPNETKTVEFVDE